MEKEEFGMRRKQDIVAAVNAHKRYVTKDIIKERPQKIWMRTLVYWKRGRGAKAIEFNGQNIENPAEQEPQCFSFEALMKGEVVGGIDVKLRKLGRRSASDARPAGTASDASPLAITLSTEAILVNQKDAANSVGIPIKGIPILIVAGRTANGISTLQLFPCAVTDDEREERILGVRPPEALVKRIEVIKAQAVDFMSPFFKGYEESALEPETK